MKTKLAVLLIAVAGLLSGCIAYDYPYGSGGEYRRDNDGYGGSDRRDHHGRGDRDGDGITDRHDQYPGDPSRY